MRLPNFPQGVEPPPFLQAKKTQMTVSNVVGHFDSAVIFSVCPGRGVKAVRPESWLHVNHVATKTNNGESAVPAASWLRRNRGAKTNKDKGQSIIVLCTASSRCQMVRGTQSLGWMSKSQKKHAQHLALLSQFQSRKPAGCCQDEICFHDAVFLFFLGVAVAHEPGENSSSRDNSSSGGSSSKWRRLETAPPVARRRSPAQAARTSVPTT
jgi:hypothetical protein